VTLEATGIEPWNVTDDPANPQPNIWPQCTTCDTAWIWRRCMSMSKGWIWLWTRDCKHKSQPALHTADGPYQPDTEEEGAAE
jgi:hypothetical protein